MSSRFHEGLHAGRVLLMDGAMGTELVRAGIKPGDCHELWNVANPDRVLRIHRDYVEAGAEVLITNTFQANPAALAKHGLEDKLEVICRAGLALARQAAGGNSFILGDIGPFPQSTEAPPRIASALADSDGLLLETQSDPCAAAVTVMPRHFRGPLLLSCTFLHSASGELQTHTGLTPEDIAKAATQLPYAALGVNCGRDIDMDDIVEIIRRYRTITALPLFARPNAGTPVEAGGAFNHPRGPEAMAAMLADVLQNRVAMIGGCCGTTPAHIAAWKPIVEDWNRSNQHGVELRQH